MIIHQADFTGSYPDYRQAPKDERPEFAFIGRSNVGKSSLINMLVERKDLARTSNVPGKTQLLNYFLINEDWYLVDLPGYGYAQVSKKLRKKWRQMMNAYFINRENLVCVFVLIDSNVSPQKIDLDFINWLGENRIPFVILYTKSDRCKAAELERNIAAFREALAEYWELLPPDVVTSANKQTGRDDVFQIIQDTLDRIQA
jgi:GTP-binding protein